MGNAFSIFLAAVRDGNLMILTFAVCLLDVWLAWFVYRKVLNSVQEMLTKLVASSDTANAEFTEGLDNLENTLKEVISISGNEHNLTQQDLKALMGKVESLSATSAELRGILNTSILTSRGLK